VSEDIRKPIYLDYNATTPHDPEVVDAMEPFLRDNYGNPSSSHWYGIQARKAVEKARGQVASLLACEPEEIVFTSGGTESNNFAIRGLAFAHSESGNQIITTEIEHPAVLEVCKYLERNGFDVTYLPVDEDGVLDVADLERAITSRTIAISVMHANNEVGTIQPIESISQVAKEYRIPFHTDAAQSVGKIRTDVEELGVTFLSIAGHKLYAPKGIGALYMRGAAPLVKLMLGAGQERGKRAGTENLLGIVGLGKACEIAKRDAKTYRSQATAMRNKLFEGLRDRIADLRLNGHPEQRLPNTLSVSIKGLDASVLLSEIGEHVAASAGAACHAGAVEISHVLRAMGIPDEWARGTVRLSVGKATSEAEIREAIDVIADAVEMLRNRNEVGRNES